MRSELAWLAQIARDSLSQIGMMSQQVELEIVDLVEDHDYEDECAREQ